MMSVPSLGDLVRETKDKGTSNRYSRQRKVFVRVMRMSWGSNWSNAFLLFNERKDLYEPTDSRCPVSSLVIRLGFRHAPAGRCSAANCNRRSYCRQNRLRTRIV